MLNYIVEGGRKLEGTVPISGSKNASLPIIAGCILNGDITKLYNVPMIHDTKITLKILKLLGCRIKKDKNKVQINSKYMNKVTIPEDLMHQMRSTVIMVGAMLGRFKQATFSYPGGCDIGKRPIDLHLKAFRKLGINIEEKYGFIRCSCDKIIGTNIDLDFPSVGATENIILATVLSQGTTVISNAAKEPEIVDLTNFLNRMGAKIEGAGTDIVKITGVSSLKKVGYKIMPDRIEAGTYLCMAAATSGRLKLTNVNKDHIMPVIDKLIEAGCNIDINKSHKNTIDIEGPKRLKAVDIETMPYPGFPTDMQSVFASIMVKADGEASIVENIFENRYKYLNELEKMGAKISINEKIAKIKGVRKLKPGSVKCTDLRGGAALVIAALSTKGKTYISDIEHILRGYEDLSIKLTNIGAKIYIKEGE